MNIKLIAIGKTDNKALQSLIDDYTKRLSFYIKFELEIIPDIKNVKNVSESQQKEKEGELILAKVQNSDVLILLDENGKQIMNFMLTTFLVGIVYILGIVAVVMTLYTNASTDQGEATFSAMGIVTILLFAAGFSIAYVVFIILASIKAYNGQVGKYPLTIRFIR